MVATKFILQLELRIKRFSLVVVNPCIPLYGSVVICKSCACCHFCSFEVFKLWQDTTPEL